MNIGPTHKFDSQWEVRQVMCLEITLEPQSAEFILYKPWGPSLRPLEVFYSYSAGIEFTGSRL